MIIIIDTSSLLSLVRYYLPFDSKDKIYNFFKEKIEAGEIIILDKVVEECIYTSKGIVLDKLKYLSEKKFQVNTKDLLPTRKFYNQLENQFINASTRKILNEIEFETRKQEFLDSADAKIILKCYSKSSKGEKYIVVTEESEASNDNKSFKKIPAICKMLDIECITLPQYLETHPEIDINI